MCVCVCVCVFVCVCVVLKKRGNKSIFDSSIEKVKVGLITTIYNLIFLLLLDIIYDIFHVEYAWIDVEEGSIK